MLESYNEINNKFFSFCKIYKEELFEKDSNNKLKILTELKSDSNEFNETVNIESNSKEDSIMLYGEEVGQFFINSGFNSIYLSSLKDIYGLESITGSISTKYF